MATGYLVNGIIYVCAIICLKEYNYWAFETRCVCILFKNGVKNPILRVFYMLFLLFANSHQHTTFGICNYAISYHFLLCLQFLVSYCIWGGQRMDDVSV